MRRALIALVVGTLLASPAAGAELSGTLKKIKTTKTMVIGYREASPPFSFVGDDGKPAGYSVDLCLAIAAAVQKDLGLPTLGLKWVKVTVANRLAMVAQGTVDIECGSTTNTLSRQERVDFTNMTFVDGGSLLVTDASGIDGVSDLGGKRVAVIPGTTTEKALIDALRTRGITTQVVPVKDHDEGIAALEKGAADAYASDRVLLTGLGRKAKDPSTLALVREFFSYEPYGLMVRRGDPDFRLAANRALARLYRSGHIVEIYEKWFREMGQPSTMLRAMYLLHALPE